MMRHECTTHPSPETDCSGADLLKLRHRHKWFAASSRQSPDEWHGPFNSMEYAARELMLAGHGDEMPIFVAQGRKLKKAEREDMGVLYEWEVDAAAAIEIRLPNNRSSVPPAAAGGG